MLNAKIVQSSPGLRYSKFKPYNKEMRAREELALGHFM